MKKRFDISFDRAYHFSPKDMPCKQLYLRPFEMFSVIFVLATYCFKDKISGITFIPNKGYSWKEFPATYNIRHSLAIKLPYCFYVPAWC